MECLHLDENQVSLLHQKWSGSLPETQYCCWNPDVSAGQIPGSLLARRVQGESHAQAGSGKFGETQHFFFIGKEANNFFYIKKKTSLKEVSILC